jgi:hypothetical protein
MRRRMWHSTVSGRARRPCSKRYGSPAMSASAGGGAFRAPAGARGSVPRWTYSCASSVPRWRFRTLPRKCQEIAGFRSTVLPQAAAQVANGLEAIDRTWDLAPRSDVVTATLKKSSSDHHKTCLSTLRERGNCRWRLLLLLHGACVEALSVGAGWCSMYRRQVDGRFNHAN